MQPSVLTGVRVLEVAGRVSTAAAGRYLRLLGADVTSVEFESGSATRRYGPFAADAPEESADSALYLYLGAGKANSRLDRRVDDWSVSLVRDAAAADVVLTDDTAWPTAAQELADVDAVTVFVTDDDDPRPSRPLTRFHRGGEASLLPAGETDPSVAPVRSGVLAGELHAAAAIAVTGLLHYYARLVRGARGVVRFSQYEYSISLNKGFISFPLAAGLDVRREDQVLPLGGVHPCLDGEVVIVPTEQHQFGRLATVLEQPTWSDLDLAQRTEREAELIAGIRAWTSTRSKWDAYAACAAAGIPAAPIIAPGEVLEVEYFRRRGFWEYLDGWAGAVLTAPTLAFDPPGGRPDPLPVEPVEPLSDRTETIEPLP